MFKLAVCILAFAASASASLAGLTASSGFSIANVNPATGATVLTQKSLVSRPDASIALSGAINTDSDVFWSLQSGSGIGSAYLVRQDVRFGGRREECAISTDTRPIHIFKSADVSESVLAIVRTNSGFGITRLSINPNNRMCTGVTITSLPSVNSVSATAFAQSGNNIFFLTEASTGFTATAGAQLRMYSIENNVATPLSTSGISLGSAFVSSIVATSDTIVQAIGFDKADSKFKVWTVDTATSTVASTTRSIPEASSSDSVEISTAAAFVAKSSTLYFTKLIRSASSDDKPVLGSLDFSEGSTSAEVTGSSTLGSGVFNLFDLSESAITSIDVDATTPNGIRVRAPNAFASTTEASSISRCSFKVGTADATFITAVASSTVEGVVCKFTQSSNGLAATVETAFAADGVNYGPVTRFSYGGSTPTSIRFDRSSYSLDDGVAFPSNRRPIQAEIFDADGNKMILTSTITATIAASSSEASIKSIVGSSASSTSGRLLFPNFAIDTFSSTQADGMSDFQLAINVGSVTATANAVVRHVSRTFGTIGSLGLSGTSLEVALVNPSANTVALGTRSLTTDSSVSLGLNTYDADNMVYNTVEVSSNGTPLLVGKSITSTSNLVGTGTCTIPNTLNVRDTPVQITYEKTNENGSVDFLALVVLSGVDGTNFKIVRITRTASSIATTSCTVVTIDQLPQSELSYAHGAFLNNGRVAIIERETIFASSQSSRLSVWRMTVDNNAGGWVVRNKALSFSVIGLAQTGDNEISISGSVTASGSVTSGVWRIDLSDDTSSIIAPVSGFSTFTTNDEQAYFLYAGHPDSENNYYTAMTASSSDVRRLETLAIVSGQAPIVATTSSVFTNNFLDLFPVADPVITTVTPSSVSSSAEISVTGSNIIKSSSLKCRFSTSGLANIDVDVVAATDTTVTFPAAGTTQSCGAIPPNFLGAARSVFVQLSNDGGANFGPASCISVAGGACPTIAGVTAVNPSTAPSNTGSSTIPVNRQIVFFFAGKTATDCAASVATINAFLTAAGVQFTAVTEADCVFNANYISTAITTSSVRMLQGTSGIVINSVLSSAADKNTAVAFAQTAAGQTALGGATLNDANPATTVSDDDDGLTDGEIAGIVIGSVAGVVLIGALIAFALKGSSKKAPAAAASPAATYSTRDATFTDATTASGSYDSTGASGSYDSTSGSYDSDSGSYDSEDYSDYSGSSYV